MARERLRGKFLIVVILILMASVVRAEVVLKVEDGSGSGIISIPVSVSSAGGVAGLQFKLNFDPALLSALDRGVVVAGELTKGWSIQANHGSGWVSVVMFNPALKPITEDKGILAYVKLKVNDNAASGKSDALRITAVVIADSKGKAMSSSSVDGKFTK